jgi:hypothetical protein
LLQHYLLPDARLASEKEEKVMTWASRLSLLGQKMYFRISYMAFRMRYGMMMIGFRRSFCWTRGWDEWIRLGIFLYDAMEVERVLGGTVYGGLF